MVLVCGEYGVETLRHSQFLCRLRREVREGKSAVFGDGLCGKTVRCGRWRERKGRRETEGVGRKLRLRCRTLPSFFLSFLPLPPSPLTLCSARGWGG